MASTNRAAYPPYPSSTAGTPAQSTYTPPGYAGYGATNGANGEPYAGSSGLNQSLDFKSSPFYNRETCIGDVQPCEGECWLETDDGPETRG